MQVRPAGWVLIGGLLSLCACASTRMSTHDIYAELAFGGGVICTPVTDSAREQSEDEHFQDKLRALGPWLVAEIGRAELDRMAAEYQDMMGTTDWTGRCPSPEDDSHQRTRRWTLLHELENRARAHPVPPSQNGGRL